MTFPSVGSLLKITPQPQVITWTRDVHSNSVAFADFGPDPATELVIRSESALEHDDDSPPDFSLDARAVNFPFLLLPHERIELSPYLIPAYPDDQVAVGQWAHTFWSPGQPIETFVLSERMNQTIACALVYYARDAPGVQRPALTLKLTLVHAAIWPRCLSKPDGFSGCLRVL